MNYELYSHSKFVFLWKMLSCELPSPFKYVYILHNMENRHQKCYVPILNMYFNGKMLLCELY